MSGDLLIHSPVWDDALAYGNGNSYDFGPMFQPIRRYLKGVDLAICHVETPITTGPPTGYPIFSAPADLAVGIGRAGWRACDTASNHSVDQGQAGIDETGRLLSAQKVRYTGSAPSAAAARRPVILRAGPARVGLVAYTDATNGMPPPSPWSVNLLAAADPARTKAATVARDVKRTLAAGADTVIVSLQWGDENSSQPNSSQRELARRIVRIDGVAAIAGQGPHVVQPIERIAGKFVIFSSGNLLSNQSPLADLPAATQDGLIALLRFVETGRGYEVKRIDYVPTMVDLDGHVVLPVGRASRTRPELAGALADSWQRTVDVAGRGPNLRPVPERRP
jgi:poly-gamma-glutamate synthesis protein (capsule biosynthesis protein)